MDTLKAIWEFLFGVDWHVYVAIVICSPSLLLVVRGIFRYVKERKNNEYVSGFFIRSLFAFPVLVSGPFTVIVFAFTPAPLTWGGVIVFFVITYVLVFIPTYAILNSGLNLLQRKK